MKNFILTIVTIAFIGVSSLKAQTKCTQNTLVNINHKSKSQVEVTLKKNPEDVVKINIYGKTGVLLHRDVLKKENYIRLSYDISQFPDGVYSIEVVENKNTIKQANLNLLQFEQDQIAKQ